MPVVASLQEACRKRSASEACFADATAAALQVRLIARCSDGYRCCSTESNKQWNGREDATMDWATDSEQSYQPAREPSCNTEGTCTNSSDAEQASQGGSSGKGALRTDEVHNEGGHRAAAEYAQAGRGASRAPSALECSSGSSADETAAPGRAAAVATGASAQGRADTGCCTRTPALLPARLSIRRAPAEALLPFKRGREICPPFMVQVSVRRAAAWHASVRAASQRADAGCAACMTWNACE
jgi:hypothetical protein